MNPYTPSERFDAGISIVQEVFAFVKENYPERREGRAPLARMGVWGKGQQSLAPPQRTEVPERE
jgi:hypothetical protein